MENKTVQEILKEKVESGFLDSEDARVYSPVFGDCFLRSAVISDKIVISDASCRSGGKLQLLVLDPDGKATNGGAMMIFPSDKMSSWRKFAWERYFLLSSSDGKKTTFFDSWLDSKYTEFAGFYFTVEDGQVHKVSKRYKTSKFFDVDEEFAKKCYNTMCHAIDEPIPELEVAVPLYKEVVDEYTRKKALARLVSEELGKECRKSLGKMTARALAAKNYPVESNIYYYEPKDSKTHFYIARLKCLSPDKSLVFFCDLIKVSCFSHRTYYHKDVKESPSLCVNWRLASKDEAKLLGDIVDEVRTDPDGKHVTPILAFKPKDWCLMRNSDEETWELCQFAYDASERAEDDLFVAVGGINFYQCIPYEGNEQLLGTTKSPDDGK